MLAKHDPAAVRRRRERGKRRLRTHLHLTLAGLTAQLLDAVGIHRRTHASGAEVAAARAERMRAVHADVAGVELQRVTALYPVPLERFEVELRHDRVAVVRIEDVDV